ncbi:MAG: hypothetical protein H6739_35750 [Alphaproteobacteria bacterium]|nr:hypothetical protein [Alphaproteobacteria bacterium]
MHVLLMVLLNGGCVPSPYTVTIDRTIEQVALSPAPTGPMAVGPAHLQGQKVISGGFWRGAANDLDQGLDSGAPGMVLTPGGAWGAGAWAPLDGWTLGAFGQVALGSRQVLLARDLDPALIPPDRLPGFGLHTRYRFARDREGPSFGVLGQLSGHLVVMSRQVTEEEWVAREDGVEHTEPVTRVETSELLLPRGGAGVFLDRRSDAGGVQASAMIQTANVFFGRLESDFQCSYEGGEPTEDCVGVERASEVRAWRPQPLLTFAVDADLVLEPLVLGAGVWAHAGTGVPRGSPVGIRATMGVLF